MKNRRKSRIISALLVLCLTLAPISALAADPAAASPQTTKPVYIYLARHGQTLTNQTHRFVSGQGNTPLTEDGRKVAYQLGLGLSGVKFEAAYASTLGRTQETAALILGQSQTSRDLLVQPVADLRECDGGFFEPMDYGGLAQQYGMRFDQTVEQFLNQFYGKDKTGVAESYTEFRDRVMSSFHKICEESAKTGGNILMVAHGGVNNMIAAEIMQKKDLEALENSSLVLVEYKDGKYSVLRYNDLSYVEQAVKKIETPQPVELYLAVHAETLTDQQGRLSGVLDTQLTENGKKQAADLGRKLADVEFAAVYASDQFKDIDTAKLVVQENKKNKSLMVNGDAAYRGAACGYFDGELWTAVKKVSSSGATAKQRLAAYGAADQTGMTESYENAEKRLVGGVKDICQETRSIGGGSVLLVTSELGCQLVAEAFGGKVPQRLVPGSVIRITYDGSRYTVQAK